MVNEVRIYFEGGGPGGWPRARQGFGRFLHPLREAARRANVRFSIIPCGSRESTYKDFKQAVATNTHAVNILLVDSEEPVKSAPWQHLRQQDGWSKPTGIHDRHCHLMARAMETWLIADPEGLASYYGQGFNRAALPRHADIEAVAPAQLTAALVGATRATKEGTYNKGQHAFGVLTKVDTQRVRAKARHCDRLFQVVGTIIDEIRNLRMPPR